MHVINYESVDEHLFLLEQLAHGSYPTVKSLYDRFGESGSTHVHETELYIEHARYKDWVGYLVSDYMVQCSTRTRVIQDSYNFNIDNGDEGVYSPDAEAYERFHGVARSCKGDVKLSVRECCNKVIHAEKFELNFVVDADNRFEYWDGKCSLFGRIGKKEWHIEIDIKIWVLAMNWYYALIREL